MHNQNNADPDADTESHETELPIPLPPPGAFTKFNDFPLEIQRNIFEIAYYLTEDDWGLDWVYISRNVKEWINPLIYESIVLPEDFGEGHKRLEHYERTFRSKPKEFYTKSVRRIYTNNNLPNSNFELELLQICDNLVSLECWSDVREELTAVLKTKTWPKLKTLCINIDLLPKDENTFRLPLFKFVTHLDISSVEPELPSWKGLKFLDNLTHMRVNMLGETESHQFRLAMDQAHVIATKARNCFPPNLEYFVILIPIIFLYHICNMEHEGRDTQRWERMESLKLGSFDPRIMLGCYGDLEDWYNDHNIEDDLVGNLVDYNSFVPCLSYIIWPQDHLDEDEKDRWAEVLLKGRERKKEFLTSQKN